MRWWVRAVAVVGFLAGALVAGNSVFADKYNADYSFIYTTSAQNPYPSQYTDEVVWVRLSHGYAGAYPLVGVPVHTVWNYRTSTPSTDWQTGDDGKAALIRDISDADCGFTVRVDIWVQMSGDWVQLDSAYFTPCGAGNYGAPSYPSSVYNQVPVYSPPPAYNAPPSAPVTQGPVAGSGTTCPDGYPIKANDNSGIYHVPGGAYYDVTNARNCFATEAAAQAAGYRASKV